MISVAELAALPLFANRVPPDELERVSQTAADLRLGAGEYAAHEGDERALFIVISGRIEVTKSIEGVVRKIGVRAPGQIFGEIPIIFGTPFQGSFHATEPSRVMRLEARQFHTLAAAVPEVLVDVAAQARDRIGGLQGIATKPGKPRCLVVGHRFDNACQRLRNFLGRNQITFEWLTPDSPELAKRWPDAPLEQLPALRTDEATLICPRAREVAELLGLQTCAGQVDGEYDAVVIGGGPAGLAAAVYSASEGLRTIVIEREAPGGQAGTSSRIENYLGFPTGVSGDELARRALQQAKRMGAEIVVTRNVVGLDSQARCVELEGGERVRGRTIVIATGVSWRRLALDGFERFLGKGVYYGAARSDAGSTHGLDIHIIGAGNSAGQAALNFSSHARSVTLVVRGDSLEKSMAHYLTSQIRGKSNIVVALRSEVHAVHGAESMKAVDIVERSSGAVRREDSGGVFVFIGADAETAWLPAEIARDRHGYVLTGDLVLKDGRWHGHRDPYLLETSVPGIFACGDVRSGPVKRVATAVGEGSMVVAFIHQFLSSTAR
jgi:thioredoxin reductase (NADPH)